MCGRFGLALDGLELAELLQLDLDLDDLSALKPRYNIAPSQAAPVVRLDKRGRRRLQPVRWGLVPSWARDRSIASNLINARAETAGDKPSFREALGRRRCLVPTDGFYEWKKLGNGKQAYHIGPGQGRLLCFAGLWERWMDPESRSPLDTFTILTTTPNGVMEGLHHRMPVVLTPETYDRWLDRRYGATEVQDLLKPCADEVLVTWPVSPLVNSPANDVPACRDRIDAPDFTQ